MKKLIYTIMVIIFAAASPVTARRASASSRQAATLQVSADYPTIQAAIDASVDGDTVIVAPGTYTGFGNRNIDFLGKAITVRSESGPENCIIDCQGTKNNPHRGFNFHRREDSSSVLDGFTISNGYANGYEIKNGGGIHCNRSSPTIRNCIISNNSAFWDQPGGYAFGGGMDNHNASPIVINCIFKDNSAQWGGGMSNYMKSNPRVINCTFTNNSGLGGGMFNTHSSNLVVGNCLFIGNSGKMGGGMWNYQSYPKISNSMFCDNHARNGGGGIYNRESCPVLRNCTFSRNAPGRGGGMYNDKCTSRLINCIVWNNSCPQIADEHNTTSLVTYSDVHGGWPGKGNINTDPCFVDPYNGDYRLLAESPCIDAGDPRYLGYINETDLDGNPRVIGGGIDMGAYEFSNTPPVADAGADQTAYAWIDGIAEVNLDGSASYDDDGDALTYLWSWQIGSVIYETNGVNPIIELLVGQHIIELVVNDGVEDSEPNHTTVTAIEPLQCKLWIMPRVINRKSQGRRLIAWLQLPPMITEEDIDTDYPLTMYPGEIEATRKFIFTNMRKGLYCTNILAFFDRRDLIEAVGDENRVRIEVAGRLNNGRYFYGSRKVRIITKLRR